MITDHDGKNSVGHAMSLTPTGNCNGVGEDQDGVQYEKEGESGMKSSRPGSDRQSAASRNTNRQLPAHVLEETRREQNLEVKLHLEDGAFVVFQKKPLHLPLQEQADDSGIDGWGGDESVGQQVFDSPVH